MNTEQLESISKIADLLNDRSLAKGIGDCLQVLAQLAARNLTESPLLIAPQSDEEPSTVDSQPTSECSEEDDFFACEYRSVKEVSEFISKSKTFVREQIYGGMFDARKNPDNGYYEISTVSVKQFVADQLETEVTCLK